MKRLLCLLLLCSLLLSGCFFNFELPDILPPGFPDLNWDNHVTEGSDTAPASSQATADQSTEPATTAAPLPIITVIFEVILEDGKEYARITAIGEGAGTVWTAETDRYDQSQLSRVTEIGSCPWLQKYYYVDDGDVVALDLQTGFELWRYAGFNGAPASKDATYIDAAGTVYLCGFFGPDYFAIDTNGNVLDCIQELHPDYYWAHKLIPGDGVMTVCLSGGPEGDMGPEAYKIDVSTEGYPQLIYGAAP